MEELCYVFISRCLFNVRLLCCCSWNRHQQTALINQVSRKKTDQERRNNGTNFAAIQRNKGATVAVTKSIFFSSGSLGASPQHYNAVFLILVFVFHFFKYFYIIFFVSYLKEKTRCNVFFNVACTPCTKYEFILAIQYFWISIFRYEANYWFVFIWFFNSAPQLWARNLLWAKFRVVAALIRTGKQTQKKSYCVSEARGEEYKTSGMYWRVLDDEEAAAY